MKRPVIGITLGDPSGIGPEVVLKSLGSASVRRACRPLVIGDAQVLAGSRACGPLKLRVCLNPMNALYRPGAVDVLHVPAQDRRKLAVGRPTAAGGRASYDGVKKSIELALLRLVDGVVHAPISKLAWNMAGVPYPGHTELIADMCGRKDFAMAIAAGPLRTVLATRHIPLGEVPKRLRPQHVVRAALQAAGWMRRIGIRRPRIAVCALNPHGGESGLLGREEIRVIRPAVRMAERKLRFPVAGPVPADSAFRDHGRGAYDCLVTLYHDQSLIPLKLTDPRGLVNITLGLPFARTSPGHGTAFDIAGKNRADPGPMCAAILEAARLCAS